MGLSIKGKLLLFTLSISLIPIAVITSMYYINSRNSLRLQALHNLTAVAESEKNNVITFLKEKKIRTIDFSTDVFIREKLETITYGRKYKAIKNLNKHLSANTKLLDPSIVGIAVLDTEGRIVASTHREIIGQDMSHQEAFTQAVKKGHGETFTGQSHHSPEFNTNAIFISAPIFTANGNGEVIGVIINVYDPEMLTDTAHTAAKEGRTVDCSFDIFIRNNLDIINRGNILNKKEAVIALNSHLLMNKKVLDPYITAIDVANQHGRVVASTSEKLIGRDVFEQEAFAKERNKIYDESCISNPHFNPHLNTNVIDFSAPITYKGQVIGVIVNHYGLSVLSDITTKNTGHDGSRETLLGMKRGDNIVILTPLRYVDFPPLTLSIPMDSSGAEPMQLALTAEAGTVIAPDYRGVDVAAAYQHIQMTDWGLVVKEDKDEVFAPLRVLGIIALIVGFISAVVVIGVSVAFAVSISRPIRELTYATERLAGGDLKHALKITRSDELGVLAGSFDTMRIQLGKYLKNIEEGRKEWESTFDSVRDIIILWNKECRLVRCNRALLEDLNVKSEDIIGKNCHEIFPQISYEDLNKCAVAETTKSLKPVTREIEVLCLNGVFSISTFPRFDVNGEFVGTVQIMRDITERKHAEDKLKLYSYQQEAIIKIGRHALTGIGISTLFDEAVANVTQILGVEFCKILELQPDGKTFLLIAGVGWKEGYVGHATVGAGSDSQAGYTLLSNKPVIVEDLRAEIRFSGPQLLKDHGVISGMSVIIQGKKRPFGVLGVHTTRPRKFCKDDVSFIQTIANVLAESIEREKIEIQFRSIFDNSADGIIAINEQGIIRLFNPAAEKLFGCTSAETIGRNVKMLMPEPYQSKHDGYLSHYLSTGEGRIIGIGPREVEALRHDGTTFPMELAITEMNLGEQRMFVGIVRDITGRKAMEKNIRESYKMASLGQLTAGVCHEVLNPLNIISSYTQLLLTDTEKGSKTEKDLNKIMEEVDRIVKITDSLLRFSRKKELKAGEVEINSLLEEIISIVEAEIKLENIKLLARFEEGLPKIMANRDELRQVFLNLATNAKNAMPDGGNLTISTQSIEKQGEPFIRMKFKDNGSGISGENIDKIFDPFFTTKEEGKGTGLGLSISYGIIKNHGGTISVNSKEGKGTTFTVDLPIEDC